MQDSVATAYHYVLDTVVAANPITLASVALASLVCISLSIYFFFSIVAPRPRPSEPSEKFYTTVSANGKITDPLPLPCWQDDSIRRVKQRREAETATTAAELDVDPPSVFLSVVVPAYNEEARIVGMLEEAVNYLEENYGTNHFPPSTATSFAPNGNGTAHHPAGNGSELTGWEIIIVSDGSTDSTLSTVHNFTKSHLLPLLPRRVSGPWTHSSPRSVNIPPGTIRVVSLSRNRGKGGAVTHGLRHVRGKYCIFADADGASKFSDLGRLVSTAEELSQKDPMGLSRAVVVGSRAHLVSSPTVVQRSALRNFLMYSFHTLLKLLTPPATASIKDTQCGFKLFTRTALPYIIPYMHSEGWIFDVEMLMLAESAGIRVAEVAVGWREVGGSKLNVIWDSLGMAWGLGVLRACWLLGVYRRGVLPEARTAATVAAAGAGPEKGDQGAITKEKEKQKQKKKRT